MQILAEVKRVEAQNDPVRSEEHLSAQLDELLSNLGFRARDTNRRVTLYDHKNYDHYLTLTLATEIDILAKKYKGWAFLIRNIPPTSDTLRHPIVGYETSEVQDHEYTFLAAINLHQGGFNAPEIFFPLCDSHLSWSRLNTAERTYIGSSSSIDGQSEEIKGLIKVVQHSADLTAHLLNLSSPHVTVDLTKTQDTNIVARYSLMF